MNVYERIHDSIRAHTSLICIGLDSDFNKLPESVRSNEFPQFAFNKQIIDRTHDLVAAYKPNTAFYESRGAAGITELKMTCDYIKKAYPELFLILDAKRADIGSTNEGYASFAFDYLQADAITLHPYLGREALLPFLNRKDKGCIVLCKTSNPGAAEIQDLSVGGFPVYLTIAQHVTLDWNTNGNCLLVVGATYPEEIKKVRAVVGDMPFLVPGIGAQGGDIEKTVRAGMDSRGGGMFINVSRSVLFADSSKKFADAAREETLKLKDAVNLIRKAVIKGGEL